MVPFQNLSHFLGLHQLDDEAEKLGFFISCESEARQVCLLQMSKAHCVWHLGLRIREDATFVVVTHVLLLIIQQTILKSEGFFLALLFYMFSLKCIQKVP